MPGGVPFPVYILSGLVVWNFFLSGHYSFNERISVGGW